jgi:hypothetical protein
MGVTPGGVMRHDAPHTFDLDHRSQVLRATVPKLGWKDRVKNGAAWLTDHVLPTWRPQLTTGGPWAGRYALRSGAATGKREAPAAGRENRGVPITSGTAGVGLTTTAVGSDGNRSGRP